MKAFVLSLMLVMAAIRAHAGSIALVDIYTPSDVKIAFVSNFQNADCKLLRSDFTDNLYVASIRAVRVNPSLAQKWVVIVENSMVADDPSCLLR